MKQYIFPAIILLFLFSKAALCFNHPEIKWKSVVTDHFIIHYNDQTETAVIQHGKSRKSSTPRFPIFTTTPHGKKSTSRLPTTTITATAMPLDQRQHHYLDH